MVFGAMAVGRAGRGGISHLPALQGQRLPVGHRMSISDGQRRSFERGMQLDAGQGMITAQRSEIICCRLEFCAPVARDLPSLATILSQPSDGVDPLRGGRSSCVGGLLHLMRPGERSLPQSLSLVGKDDPDIARCRQRLPSIILVLRIIRRSFSIILISSGLMNDHLCWQVSY